MNPQMPVVEAQRRRLVVERILRHISASGCGDDFAVRGAWSFAAWFGELHRETRALDLVYLGSRLPGAALRDACPSTGPLAIRWGDCDAFEAGDGWTQRTRVQLSALHRGRELGLTVNIAHNVRNAGYVERRRFRGQSPVAPIMVHCLSPEWFIAEKAALLVTYGPDHTRLQDLLDLWILHIRLEFDRDALVEAFTEVSRGRDAERMVRRNDGYWEAAFHTVGKSRAMFQRWDILTAGCPAGLAPGLPKALMEVADFLWPVLTDVREATAPFRRTRAPGRHPLALGGIQVKPTQAAFAF